MPSDFTIESLEIIIRSGLIAATVLSVVLSGATILAYLLTRESSHSLSTASKAAPATGETHNYQVPSAIAG
jgi:hypothetical protein